MSNEVQVVEDIPSELAIARPPDVVLLEAKKAADALKDVISKKHKPVIFNGEQYLEFEDWQTVGNFYGLKAKTGEAEPVTIDGVAGAKAKAEVIDIRSGRVVGGAEAYCLRDEPNWARKPWFQLASMAQTRAGSKSLRNILAWVVVLAGYRPTPAEEMEGVLKPNIPQVRPQSKPEDGAQYEPPQSNLENAAPPQSAAEFARRKAEEMPDDPYVDGFVTNWQPYSGTKRNEKGKRPGQFDLDDGQETIVMKWIKYFDPAMEEQLKSGGLKRVFYKEDTYNGKTQYQAVKVEPQE